MTEVLSQQEIDQLLSAISAPAEDKFKSIEDFETFLTKREHNPESPYGLCQKDVSICKFFEDQNSENILSDIIQKNQKDEMGNIEIPNTKIKLINYSYCPKCRRIFTFRDLVNYYSDPKPDPTIKNIIEQYRHDTRVFCFECNTYFIPTLVISDGTPKNAVQFLCRVQTIDTIEAFFLDKKIRVLTRDKKNILTKNGRRAIRNDVVLKQLEPRPALISNLLQFTPAPLMLNLIDGTNIEKADILFGEWRPIS